MKIKILTLFPAILKNVFEESIIKRAIEKGICSVELIDIRNYSLDKHHHVDDTPYGGGAGMVLACDVVDRAIIASATSNAHKILMTPQGKKYQQQDAYRLAKFEELVLICGHYEGFDERIRNFVDEEISIGDFILTGGELPAAILADSIIRLLDEAIKEASHEDDSFSNGLLEYPQYTRPLEYKGMGVPKVLTNGNHHDIAKYRKKEAIRKTYLRRRDLLDQYPFTIEEQELFLEVLEEERQNEKLSEMLAKATPFIYQMARPLDLALWKYHFEGGSKEQVLKMLKAYQNADGGFGHGLDLNCLNPYSSPIQTWKAMNILEEIQVDNKKDPIVKGILKYLASMKSFDVKQNQWQFAIPSNSSFPHARWWEYHEENKLTYNPTAYISGFILYYGNKETKLYQKAYELAKEAIEALENISDGEAIKNSYLGLYNFLVKANVLQEKLPSFRQKLVEKIGLILDKDTSKWYDTYVKMPSDFFKNENSLGIEEFKEFISQELEMLPTKQNGDGSFGINRQWGTDYQEEALAKYLMKVEITKEKLLFYKSFAK